MGTNTFWVHPPGIVPHATYPWAYAKNARYYAAKYSQSTPLIIRRGGEYMRNTKPTRTNTLAVYSEGLEVPKEKWAELLPELYGKGATDGD